MTVQINHQPDATIFQFIVLTFIYSSICFGPFPAHHQERNECSSSLWFYQMVKPEAATAVIELLMMGGERPETC
jgi:(2Fe-2S) ferredoxin